MNKLKETTSDDVKRQIAILLPVSIEELTRKSFSEIEKAVNLLAGKHFNGHSEALWEIFWLHHVSSETLPANSNYHDAVKQFYSFWQTLNSNTTQGTPNDIVLAAIITAQRGYERLVPYLATQLPLSELINIRDGAGNPLAHIAITHQHPAYVKALHQLIRMFIRGTKLPPDNNGTTVLHSAIFTGLTELATFIWDNHLCERSAVCQYGSALHIAITQNNEPLIILFSDTLSHLNTFAGKSPLHTAVSSLNIFAIDHLLSGQHCNIHVINEQTGNRVLDDAIVAACNHHSVLPITRSLDIINRLLQYDADLNRKNGQNITPFEYMIDQLFHFPDSERIQKTVRCVMKHDRLISPASCQSILTLYADRFSLVADALPELYHELTAIAARPEAAPHTQINS